MKSPITGKEMKLVRKPDVVMFRKDTFSIVRHYYECVDSGETFTDDRLDTINTTQATNQYREKYGIPFPEEISQIREQYGISASKMSEILGFGANTYRLYESGEMPTVASGRLILSVRDPRELIKQVEASAHFLDEKDEVKLLNKAKDLLGRKHSSLFGSGLAQVALTDAAPNSLSGYKKLNIARITHIVAYFEEKVGELYKTKLNKLLFYADFLAYKTFGFSITGLQYRAIQYGPVPAEYERLFVRLQDEDQVHVEERAGQEGQYFEVYHPNVSFDHARFSQGELQVLQEVGKRFEKMNTGNIIELSHEEPAWKENIAGKQLINYQQHAFTLTMNL